MTNLEEKKWKSFKIEDLFEVSGTYTTQPNDLISGGRTPRITCSSVNNGLENFYMNEPTENGNVLTIDSATIGSVTYQNKPFIATDHVEKITLKEKKLNKYLGLFFKSMIEQSAGNKFHYGYKFSQTRIKKQSILLPVTETGDPDYEFMELYMRELENNIINSQKDYINKQLSILGTYKEIKELNECKWKKFNVKDVFEIIQRGKRLKTADHISGETPYVSSTALNNGIDRFIGNKENVRKFKDCLSLANSGSVGSCFYEPFEFIASDHITHLKNNSFNKYHYLFMATMLNRLGDKYNFNREINDARISKEIIMLPIKNDNTPDYDYMEQYIKNVMIDKYNRLLEFIAS